MKIETGSGGPMATFWGQSYNSYDDAVKEAVAAFDAQLGSQGAVAEWLEMIEFRGGFSDGKLQYQVACRIGYYQKG